MPWLCTCSCFDLLLLRTCSGPAPLVTRETRDTRRAAHMDVRRVPPWAGCPMWDLPAKAPHSWLLIRNSPKPFLWLLLTEGNPVGLCGFGQRK
ncbi:hypothetical protein [Lysobacter gummosus]|uniref:hypothetical protein n=1 Tax=Lysobacter gummosus TaxID=262324 RepID=UPI0036341FE9